MAESIFVDTGYIIAMLVPTDEHRVAAARWTRDIAKTRTPLVISTAIIFEVMDAFNGSRRWRAADDFITRAENSSQYTVVDVDRGLFDRARELRRARPDKDWGLTDCTSFVIMQDRGITRALSCDQDFQQAGFRALLIED